MDETWDDDTENTIGKRVTLNSSGVTSVTPVSPDRAAVPVPLPKSPHRSACLESLPSFRLQLALRTGTSTGHPPPLLLVSDSGTTLEYATELKCWRIGDNEILSGWFQIPPVICCCPEHAHQHSAKRCALTLFNTRAGRIPRPMRNP